MSALGSVRGAVPGGAGAGFCRYMRFNLRQNLVRYIVWTVVIVFLVAYVGVYFNSILDTQAKIDEYAAISSTPGMVAMVGRITALDTFAGAIWAKIWMFSALTLGIGMVFQVTKGARADEENGRTELFRSRPFGIHSTLLSVVVGALLLSTVIGALVAVTGILLGLDPAGGGIAGSVVFGLSIAACGWLGVGIGALTNQLSASSSIANTSGAVVLLVFYAMRMLGDLGDDDLLTWISPIGWAEKMDPWSGDRLWLAIPFVLLTVALIAVAVYIESRRDYGSGVIGERSGSADAAPMMKTSIGFVIHTYRAGIIGWAIGMVISGLLFGSVAKSMLDIVSGAGLGMLAGSGMDALNALLLCFIGLIAVVFPLYMMTGLRSDESRGLLESQLTKSISRERLVLERFLVGAAVAAVLLALGGAAFGVSYGIVAEDMGQVATLTMGALIYLPGITAVMGIVALLFGFVPSLTIPVTWSIYGIMYLALLLGDSLDLPSWLLDAIPFMGTPRVPFEDFDPSIFWYLAAAVVFVIVGIVGFKRRDVPR